MQRRALSMPRRSQCSRGELSQCKSAGKRGENDARISYPERKQTRGKVSNGVRRECCRLHSRPRYPVSQTLPQSYKKKFIRASLRARAGAKVPSFFLKIL